MKMIKYKTRCKIIKIYNVAYKLYKSQEFWEDWSFNDCLENVKNWENEVINRWLLEK